MIVPPRNPLRFCLAKALLILFLLEFVVFTALQYVMPANLQSLWSTNKLGVDHFAFTLTGHLFPSLPDQTFRIAFCALLASLYATYTAVILALRNCPRVSVSTAIIMVAAAGSVAAIFFPPSLSSDIYSYVAYARLPAYHLNPYFHSPQLLVDAGDPVARFLPRSILDPAHRNIAWNIPTVYGPVWTVFSIAIVKITGASHLWTAVLGMKLIELGALLIAAISAGRIAGLAHPDRRAVAILCVGLNPLALVEGAGSGHNDLLMVAFALLAIACLQERKVLAGGLALGLSIGVKFVTLGLLPWLLIEIWKTSSKSAARLQFIGVTLAAALTPAILCYIPFWRGPATFGALLNRNHDIPGLSSAVQAPVAHHSYFLAAMSEHLIILILYAGLTAMVALSRRRGAWALSWTIFSSAFIYFSMGIWFPWYLLWPWLILLGSGFQGRGNGALAFIIGGVTLVLSTFYMIASGIFAVRLLGTAIWVCSCISLGEYLIQMRRLDKK